MTLPYNPPLKVHKFNRRWVLRDSLNKEVLEFTQNSYALDYEKRMIERMQFVADLMNARKTVKFHAGAYAVDLHPDAPDAPPANPSIPGLVSNAEQAMVERTIKELRIKEGEPMPPAVAPVRSFNEILDEQLGQSYASIVASTAPKPMSSIVEKVKEAVKRRGRPKKK